MKLLLPRFDVSIFNILGEYERRGTKVRSPRSARSTAPWGRRRRLTPILQINFEVSGKHFTSRYYFKKFRNFWAIRSWKLGGKNTFLGARGQGGHRRGSTPMSGALGRVPTKLFFPRSYVEIFDSFWVLLSTKIDWKSESLKSEIWKSESLKVWNLKCCLGPRGRSQGPEGVSYRLPPVSENKRDEGFILLLSYWSIIHEIGGGIPFLPLGSKGDVGGGRHGPDLNKPYYIPFSSRKRWNLLRKSDFSILSWLRIELKTSQLTRVLSKGVI